MDPGSGGTTPPEPPYDGFLFFGEDWGRHHSTGQFLAAKLAESRKLLWVNSLGLRAPRVNAADLRRAAGKLRSFAGRRRAASGGQDPQTASGITVIPPLAIPFWKYRIVRAFNRRLLRRLLLRALDTHEIHRPVILTACPSTAVFIDALPAVARIYYCADEYASLPGMDPHLVRTLEEELLGRVNLVVATSKALQEAKARLHGDVRYLPHGVDYEHFAKAWGARLERPPDLAGLQGPLIGFVGLIGEHLDFEILREVAARLPEAQLVLIGPRESRAEKLDLPNVRLLGPRDRSNLPAYLACFDVCLVPYREDERSRYANPTKCREYLAAGCPIVCTPQDEARRIGGDIRFASGKEEFVRAVRDVLEEGSGLSRQERAEVVRSQTWGARSGELLGMIRDVVKKSTVSVNLDDGKGAD